MSDLARVEADLSEAHAAIGAARTLLGQGSVVDLTGMERRVEQICADITALPESERVGLKALLVSLIDELNDFSDKMSVQHGKLSGQLQDTTNRQRATSAYGGSQGKRGGEPPKK